MCQLCAGIEALLLAFSKDHAPRYMPPRAIIAGNFNSELFDGSCVAVFLELSLPGGGGEQGGKRKQPPPRGGMTDGGGGGRIFHDVNPDDKNGAGRRDGGRQTGQGSAPRHCSCRQICAPWGGKYATGMGCTIQHWNLRDKMTWSYGGWTPIVPVQHTIRITTTTAAARRQRG